MLSVCQPSLRLIRQPLKISLIILMLTGPSAAAISVIGNSWARLCYENAEHAAGSRNDVSVCNSALNEEALDTRDRAATLVNRGILHMLSQDKTSALADYDAAIALKPNMGDAYLNRGILLLRIERDADAVEALTKGLSLGSSKPEAGYYSRAVAYEMLGNIKSAYLDYRKASELAPKWSLPQEQLSRFQVKTAHP